METKNLDGETNLKMKQVPKDVQKIVIEEQNVANFDMTMLCSEPTDQIYMFDGVFKNKKT